MWDFIIFPCYANALPSSLWPLTSTGVAGPSLPRRPQRQRLHPGVRHLLRGELWIRQDDPAADRRAPVGRRVQRPLSNLWWHRLVSASCTPRSLVSQFLQATKTHNYTFVTGWQWRIIVLPRHCIIQLLPPSPSSSPLPQLLPPSPSSSPLPSAPLPLANDIWFREQQHGSLILRLFRGFFCF